MNKIMNQDYDVNLEVLQKRISESELFTKRFGTFSKSDYEILMFTIFLDSLNEDVRDYDISIALGITESKVRNLRIKSQLLYPKEINLIKELETAILHGYYDPITGQITVTIENPSVQSMLKNEIEKNFGTVGLSMNSKQLILPIESFLIIAAMTEPDSEAVLKRLNTEIKKETKLKGKIEKKSVKERFLKEVPDVVGFLSSISGIYSVGKEIIAALIKII